MPVTMNRKNKERKTFVTERVRESVAVNMRDPYRPGTTLQYKLIATSDGSETAMQFARGLDDPSKCSIVYSVLIIKTTTDRSGTFDETVFIYDITRSEEAAVKLIDLLSENFVTPDEAKDVIDDLL